MIFIPISTAFLKHIPLTSPPERSLFWGLAAVLLRFPSAVMIDALIRMCRQLNNKTSEWKYSKVLWRSSQLYSCSFGYTLLSVIMGTYNSIAHEDLTKWSSFRLKVMHLVT